ncbi:hypothetical protein SAMN06272735_5532 [Streptomyces sp. TLI_55]|uniref:hypothetical protein n=1 Tax=Streptomyces sp. TLI_55 TaxID=1938861 RepID=UPI000BCB778A|nr:hypothetical protein [Streptomyces sp. TLI_55]SNX63721.1 hypothetical protein SAMN06272735_5532 [Streptomyces sp. TLI_55]
MSSIRFTAQARRGVAALALAAGLAVGVAGCGGGGDDDKKPESSTSAPQKGGSDPSPQEGQSDDVQAELKGSTGLILQIGDAARDSGGFVTVNGTLKNDGAKPITVPYALRGDETEIMAHDRSLGGATLVDSKEKKRYYVLRDTEGRPLTTTGLSILKAGEELPVFMQFPSPPQSTTEVTLQLPTFSSATIKISG